MSAPPTAAGKWNGPYLKKGVPMDPWGHPYQYRVPGTKGEYEIVSLGKDGQPGGTGDSADISSQ
jgi:general secretion pathway protein G